MNKIHSKAIFWILAALLSACSAQQAFEKGEFEVFINKSNLDPEENSAQTNWMIGEAYRKSNRVDKAEKYYAHAIKEGIEEEKAAIHYARALRANLDHKKAQKVLEDYLKDSRDEDLAKQAENMLQNLRKIDEVKDKESYYEINNLQDINTEYAEFSPAYRNNTLYFTSNRESSRIYEATGTGYTDLYQAASRGAKVNVSTIKKMPSVINDPRVNEGTIAISPSGNWIIFAKGNTGKASGNKNVNLYFSRFRNGQWSEPRPLSVNDPDAWDSTPTLSPEGTTLYFSSNREGGFGGDDLYAANLNRRGRWVDVRNLGPEINTAGNESFPFVSEDGKLYFASDGHPGFGKLDLFQATRRAGRIDVENLGAPINSEEDDFGMFQFDLTRGFFSSNRKGGKGDDDIYTYVNQDPDLKVVNYYLEGITLTKDDGGNDIILPHTKVLLVDSDNQLVEEAFTGEDGTFKFRVYPEENYNLIGEKTDYFTTRKEFSTVGKTVNRDTLTEFITNVNFETHILMERIVIEKPIVLENIYYDFDKANIRPDAAKVLDSLVTIMEDNPEIYIELGSHTDAREDEDYNLDLSRRRAISAVKYIIDQGIDDERIVAKGYGESRLLIKNAQTEEEHQKNRRTEFKVLRYNPKDRQENLPDEDELDEYDRFFLEDTIDG